MPIEGMLPAAIALAVFVGCAAIERWVLRSWSAPYFAIGLPLPAVRPIPSIPERVLGTTDHTRWSRNGRLLLFTGPDRRRGLLGLHGRVDLVPIATGVELKARFFPPVTPFVALGWLLAIGASRGDLALIVPLSIVAVIGMFWMHRRGATQALDEIRLALVQG